MRSYFTHSVKNLILAILFSSPFSQITLAADTNNTAASIPVENFFKSPQISAVRFSPDGKSIAMLAAGSNDKLVLSTMDVSSLKPKIVAAYLKTDVISFQWISDQRLVYSVGDRALADGEVTEGQGLYAVNKDGSEPRQLIEPGLNSEKFRVLNARHGFLATAYWANSDDIFVYRNAGSRHTPSLSLFKLNTKNGAAESIDSPSNAQSFLLDSSNQLRVVTTQNEQLTAVHYKDPKTNQWRKLAEFDASGHNGFVPLFISPDGQLYVRTRKNSDTDAVYRYDTEQNKLAETLISSPGFDFSGSFVFSKTKNKLTGVYYETDAGGSLWLDDKYKALQKTIDTALPNTVNRIYPAQDDSVPLAIVFSYSDVHPGSYLIYDSEKNKFIPIGDTHPEIDSRKMSFQEFVKVKARDGLGIPTYITLPKNSDGKNLPMVVLVHGGPYVRGGHWEWNSERQFLASRGYAVIEPEFRGSLGYGYKLFRAGWKQWGLRMQDDITDVTKWAISKGYADPQRICIAGASYGGYATLMGLIKEPELYQCGISWVGVTDINYLFDVTWSDTSGSIWAKYGMPLMVGDPVKDASQLKATSPIELAPQLKRPLILAYGGADVRVPLVHGESFRKAAPKDIPIEWIVYPEEGHGWRKLQNNIDFWNKVEKFLGTYTAKK